MVTNTTQRASLWQACALHDAIVTREEEYACELVEIIRRDCQRMEAKLIERKKEALRLKLQQTKNEEPQAKPICKTCKGFRVRMRIGDNMFGYCIRRDVLRGVQLSGDASGCKFYDNFYK